MGHNQKVGGGMLDVNAKMNEVTAKISNFLGIINNYFLQGNLTISQTRHVWLFTLSRYQVYIRN